jgi:lactate dehydrogenase-like 2-hydroxyacid dehydrogenase
MGIVFQNFHTNPARLDAARQAYARHGLTMIDNPGDGDLNRIGWIVNKTRYIDDGFVRRFPNLRGIVVLGTEAWMVHLGDARHIAVAVLDEDRGYEVAEHALALLLAGLKRLPRACVLRRRLSPGGLLSFLAPRPAGETHGAHNWSSMTTDTLYRKNVGIVGYGLIGREIHRRLAGFGAKVFYHHRTRYPETVERRLNMTFASLENLFAVCDAIFVQLPLSPDTDRLIAGQVLGKAKSNLVLVNCGRAAVIDEDALYEVLRQERIAYYAADVFWREPISYFDRFRRLKNCLITPHMAESLAGRDPDLLQQAMKKIIELSEVSHD